MSTIESVIAAASATVTLPGAAVGPVPWLPTAKTYNGTSDRDLVRSGSFNWRGEWTLSAWVWLESLPTVPNSHNAFGTGNAFNDTTGISVSSGNLHVYLGGASHGVNAIRNIPLTLFPLQQWRLLTITRDASGLMRVYSGATQVTSITLTDLSPLNHNDVYVGGHLGSNSWWKGRIAHAGLWTTALDASDVALLASGPIGPLAYVTSRQSTADLSAYPFNDFPIGFADAERGLALAVHSRGGAGEVLNSLTVDGVSATKIVGIENSTTGAGNSTNWYAIDAPTGDTADIVATFASTQARCQIDVYRLTDVDIDTIVGKATSGTRPAVLTLDVQEGGVVLAAGNVAQTGRTPTWTGATADNTANLESLVTCSCASYTGGAEVDRPVSLDWDTTGVQYAAAAISLRANASVPAKPSRLILDGAAYGPVAPAFARDIATVDSRGTAAIADALRYRQTIAHADPVTWTDTGVDVSGGTSSFIGTGLNADGEPCGVVRDLAGTRLLYIEGTDFTVVRSLALDSLTGWLSPVVSTYAIDEGTTRYWPTTALVHYGAIVLQCVRYEDKGSGFTPVGTSLGLSLDGLQSITWTDLAENTAAAGADYGMHRGGGWSMGNPFPVAGQRYDQACWVPVADYLGKSVAGNPLFPKGGQVFLARLDRDGFGPWTLSARVIHDRWQSADNGGHHAHSVATCASGLVSTWGDVTYRNHVEAHELDLTSATWLTDSVTTSIVHGGWHAPPDGSSPADYDDSSPQPAGCAPTSVDGLSVWSADLSSDAVAVLIGYDTGNTYPLTLRAGRRRVGRTAGGGTWDGYDPLHLRYIPECGYTLGGGGNPLYISDDGINWADLNAVPTPVSVWPWGRDQLAGIVSDGHIWQATRPKIQTRQAAELSPGGANTMAVASSGDNQASPVFTPDVGNSITRIKYTGGQWLYAEVGPGGELVDDPLATADIPHELPPGVDMTQDVACYLVRAVSYDVGGRRLYVGNAGQGALQCKVYTLTTNDPYLMVRPYGAGGQSGSVVKTILGGYRHWSPLTTGLGSSATGALDFEMLCGSLSGNAQDFRGILVVEGYRRTGVTARYYTPPATSGAPDEKLNWTVDADMASLALRVVWSLPDNLWAGDTGSYDLAWLWADADNHVKFSIDWSTPDVAVLTADVVVGGTSVGTLSITGDAYHNDTMDVTLSIDGTAATLGGRLGIGAFDSDSATLSGSPTETATALKFYPPSGDSATQDVVGIAYDSTPIDATDPAEVATLLVSDAPAFTTAPTCSINGSTLTFTPGVAVSQVGGAISYGLDVIRNGVTVATNQSSPVDLLAFGPGSFRVRSTATDDTAHDSTAVAVSDAATFTAGRRRRIRQLLGA